MLKLIMTLRDYVHTAAMTISVVVLLIAVTHLSKILVDFFELYRKTL